MAEATLWFDPDFQDLLKKIPAGKSFPFQWCGRRSIKDLIESMGIPHVEVGLILVNQQPVNFDYVVLSADAVEVYADCRKAGRADIKGLRVTCPGIPRFVCDVHLGQLARRLRLLGFDVKYLPGRHDQELALISFNERRFLLTRDLQLLKRGLVERGVFIRSQDTAQQLSQVCQRLELQQYFKPFSRCLSCNGELHRLDIGQPEKGHYLDSIPLKVRQWCKEYKVCTSCDKIYWPGTHFKRLLAWVRMVFPDWQPDSSGKWQDNEE